jgi:predicted enzyme involved in methoxymalonyl-ACP biosynthesis
MNYFEFYEPEELKNIQETQKELMRLLRAAQAKLEMQPESSPERQGVIELINRINQAVRETKRLHDECVELLRKIIE